MCALDHPDDLGVSSSPSDLGKTMDGVNGSRAAPPTGAATAAFDATAGGDPIAGGEMSRGAVGDLRADAGGGVAGGGEPPPPPPRAGASPPRQPPRRARRWWRATARTGTALTRRVGVIGTGAFFAGSGAFAAVFASGFFSSNIVAASVASSAAASQFSWRTRARAHPRARRRFPCWREVSRRWRTLPRGYTRVRRRCCAWPRRRELGGGDVLSFLLGGFAQKRKRLLAVLLGEVPQPLGLFLARRGGGGGVRGRLRVLRRRLHLAQQGDHLAIRLPARLELGDDFDGVGELTLERGNLRGRRPREATGT